MTELMLSGHLKNLGPDEAAALFSVLVTRVSPPRMNEA